MAPLASKKRVSKKKKIAWRKHCDTKDVDNFLDEKRFEERLGFRHAEKPDDELFQIDTAADVGSREGEVFAKNLWSVEDVKTSGKAIDKKSRRLEKLKKPLRCYEILIPQSAVEDPIKKRNRVRTPEERKHPLVRKIEAARKKKGILKAKEVIANKNRARDEARRQNKPKRGEFTEDLWGADADQESDPLDGNAEWLNPMTLQHTLKNTGRLKKKVPKSLQKKSALPAIEPPHPGMSYNPTFADHQALLQEVASKETGLIKEEKHLERVTTNMFSKVSSADKDRSWLSEMSEGLPKAEDSVKEAAGEDEKSNEYTTVNPPVKNKKKTLQQRKRQKAAQREELERQQRLVERKKVADLYKLRLLEKQFASKDQKLAKLREKRLRVKALKENEPKRLSKLKFEAPELEFNMPMEVRGSLRCLKKEGNLLNDRFKSLQRRNVLEPSSRHSAKKGKKKVFLKASHRIEAEVT